MPAFSTIAGTLLTLAAAVYALAALLCRGRTYGGGPARSPVPVTVLKPLCGAEPRLEENLATFFAQDYPCFQLVFGVRDPQDPAIDTLARLARRFPAIDMQLVIDPRVHGHNLKVSNLINMLPAARHPWLVLADSDIAVAPGYLERVTAPLHDPAVGIVTCLYRGRARDSYWSRLGAQFIDAWFAPSVRVASSFGAEAFAFGATIALRRATLDGIGGFAPLKDALADDYRLGERTRVPGLRTVLSEVVVDTDVAETTPAALCSRELRWMQTIRSLNPAGYAFSFITFTLPVLALGLLLAPTPANALLAVLGLGARLARPGRAIDAPARDGLLLLVWLAGFAGSTARWRARRLPIDTNHAEESRWTPQA